MRRGVDHLLQSFKLHTYFDINILRPDFTKCSQRLLTGTPFPTVPWTVSHKCVNGFFTCVLKGNLSFVFKPSFEFSSHHSFVIHSRWRLIVSLQNTRSVLELSFISRGVCRVRNLLLQWFSHSYLSNLLSTYVVPKLCRLVSFSTTVIKVTVYEVTLVNTNGYISVINFTFVIDLQKHSYVVLVF